MMTPEDRIPSKIEVGQIVTYNTTEYDRNTVPELNGAMTVKAKVDSLWSLGEYPWVNLWIEIDGDYKLWRPHIPIGKGEDQSYSLLVNE